MWLDCESKEMHKEFWWGNLWMQLLGRFGECKMDLQETGCKDGSWMELAMMDLQFLQYFGRNCYFFACNHYADSYLGWMVGYLFNATVSLQCIMVKTYLYRV
jgi:hypothetical protein